MTFGYDWAPPQWRAVVELDTLAAAWGLKPNEISDVIGVPIGVIDGWRRSDDEGWSGEVAAKIEAEITRAEHAIAAIGNALSLLIIRFSLLCASEATCLESIGVATAAPTSARGTPSLAGEIQPDCDDS